MSAINPFSGYVAQGSQVERLQAAEKTRQARREQVLSKDVAAQDDQMEHQVESTDAIVSIHDDQQTPPRQQHPRRDPLPEDGEQPPHIDVTA
jgi:hypothetical protein